MAVFLIRFPLPVAKYIVVVIENHAEAIDVDGLWNARGGKAFYLFMRKLSTHVCYVLNRRLPSREVAMDEKAPYVIGIQPYQPVPSHHQAPPVPQYHWQPAFFRRAPWFAILSIFLTFLCAAASAIVIAISDNQVAKWRLQPSVILALLSAVASALLLVALRYGVTISWWRAVIDPRGVTLAKLHHIWNHGGGGGILSAVLAGRDMNKIAVASIFIVVTSIIYSPLLQRASHTRSVIKSLNTTLMIDMATDFPVDAGGTVGYDGEPVLGPTFLSAIQDWYSGNNMATWDEEGYFCNGTCSGYLAAAGIMGDNCTQTREPMDVLKAGRDNSFVFSINFTRYEDDTGLPTLELAVKGLTEVNYSCVGVLVTNVCKMHVGTVNFPLIIKQNNITFDADASRQFISDPVAYAGDISTAKPGDPTGPLGALYWFGQTYFRANATLNYNQTSGNYTTSLIGFPAAQYYDSSPSETAQNCVIQFTDPTADIIRAFSDVLFRGAYYDSPNETARSFTVLHTRPTLVYQSVYSFLAAATALVFLAIIAASSTLWGWWEVGRKVSLSPLETGMALGAHVLENADSPQDVKGLVRYVGERRVRYGETYGVGRDGSTRAVLGVGQLGLGSDPLAPRRNARR